MSPRLLKSVMSRKKYIKSGKMKTVKAIRFIENPKVLDAIDMNSILGGNNADSVSCPYNCGPYGGTVTQ